MSKNTGCSTMSTTEAAAMAMVLNKETKEIYGCVFWGGSERRWWHCNAKKKVIDGCDHAHATWCPFVSHVDDDGHIYDGHDAYMQELHTYMCFSHDDGIDAYIYIYIYIYTFICIYTW